MSIDIENTTNLALEKPPRGHKAWGPSYWRTAAILDLWLTQLAKGHTVVSGGNLTVSVVVTIDATTVAFAGQTVLLSVLAQTIIPSLDISKTYLVYIDNLGTLTVTEFTNTTLLEGVDLPTDFVLIGMVFQDQGVWRAHNYPLASGRGKSLGVAPLDGDGNLPESYFPPSLDIATQLIHGWNGSNLQDPEMVISSDGAQWTLSLAGPGATDLGCLFGGEEFTFSPASIVLTEGADDSPQTNFIYLTETAGVVSLNVRTDDYPDTEIIRVADCFLQTAASGQAQLPIMSHQHSEHISRVDSGMIIHFAEKLRELGATHKSGVAASNLVVSSPDAYIGVALGEVYQLHKHDFPAISMPGDTVYVVNEPTTSFLPITTLDDIIQDALGGSIHNRHFSLVVWGSQNAGGTGQLFINLPKGTYSTAAKSADDLQKHAIYTIPALFKGTAFLIAEYQVQGNNSGTWVQNDLIDLRGQIPATSPGGGPGVTSHSDLSNLDVLADHPGYLAMDGSRIAEFLQFDLAFAGVTAEGQINWNAIDGTFEFGLPGGNVTLQIGQEFLVRAVNKTGVTINDGEIVYISGASGNRPEIALADASDSAKDEPIGLATEDIAHNNNGYVNVAGLVRDIDTSAIAVGAPGYLSATTPGALSATPSAAAHHNTVMGYCLFSNVSSGIFFVKLSHVPPHDASTTEAGLIEIATQAEVDAETDAVRAVTPETLGVYAALLLLLDGSRAMTGNLDMGTKAITNVGNVDGRDVSADGSKLDGIESGATQDQTAAEILTALKTVDGAGSGLDADLLDGIDSTRIVYGSNTTATLSGPPNNDWNDVIKSGFYTHSSSANAPVAGWINLLAVLHTNEASYYQQQLAWQLGTNNMWTRYQSAGSWSAWVKVWNADNFDDTAHGVRGGGTQHADVIAGGADGFMTGADKTKLDAISGTNTGDEPNSTTSVRGIIELATQAEVDAETDTVRAVTPATLGAWPGGGGAAGLIPIETVTADGTGSILTLNTDFDIEGMHVIVGYHLVPATDAQISRLRVSIASSVKSGASDYAWSAYFTNTSGPGNQVDASDSEIQMTGSAAIGSASGEGMDFVIFLPNPSSATQIKRMFGLVSDENSAGTSSARFWGGRYKAGVQALDGLQFSFGSGNIESGGSITHYRLASA